MNTQPTVTDADRKCWIEANGAGDKAFLERKSYDEAASAVIAAHREASNAATEELLHDVSESLKLWKRKCAEVSVSLGDAEKARDAAVARAERWRKIADRLARSEIVRVLGPNLAYSGEARAAYDALAASEQKDATKEGKR